MDAVRVRASSLSDLFDCPARWYARNIQGIRLPSSGTARLGTAVHAGAAAFDLSRIRDEHPISVDDAAGAVVDSILDQSEDTDWGDLSPKKAEPVALGLHRLYCQNVAPRFQYVAVEASGEDLEIQDLGIRLTGTTDRVFTDELGNLGVADIKTGRSVVDTAGAVKTASYAAQIGVYELLAEQATKRRITAPARVIGLQAWKTARGQRAGIGEVSGARDLLIGTEDEQGILEMAAGIIRSGAFFGNPRSSLCNEKYCPAWATCRFRR